ncbi:MAG: hypothetical protein QM606_08200 [Leucobacter sp.]
MTQTTYVIVMAAIAALALIGMGIGWRRRAKRDTGIAAPDAELSGEVLVRFRRASYVSTTPVGAPLDRVSIPALRYKGFAELTVRRDGVTIAVTGEQPVSIPAAQLRGTDTAGGRIGKAVERDGLSLLRWVPGVSTGSTDTAERTLESGFRLANPAEQAAFAEAIDHISLSPSTSQEGAQ